MVEQPRTALYLILMQRLWQAASGLMTVVLIARFLSLEQQGWYYSFNSLAAISTLFDLGLSIVLVQTAAHRSAVSGSESDGSSRALAALARSSLRQYAVLAFVYIALALPLGLFIFGATPGVFPAWRWTWAALTFCSAAALLPVPLLAVVEGSGGVRAVYEVRLAQTILGGAATWFALSYGAGLWATLGIPIAAFAVPAIWVLRRHRVLLSPPVERAARQVAWRREIWPLQWKVGLSWLAGYALTQLLSLLLFKLDGPSAAGQMGLSLTMGNMVGILAVSWLTRSVPQMGQAAARRDWTTLDLLFRGSFAISCGAYLAGVGGLCVIHWLLDFTRYGERLLPFWPFTGLLAGLFLIHVNGCLAAQLRSFRQEPLVWVAAGTSALTMLLSLATVRSFGAGGVVASLLGVQLCAAFPLSLHIWRRRNREWRALG